MTMKVIQILPRLEGGGVERGTLEVANYLVDHNVDSIVVSQGGRLVSQLIDEGSTHLLMRVGDKSIQSLTSIHRLRRLFQELKPDIVHPRSRLPAWLAYLANKGVPEKFRPRFLTSVHGLHSVSRYSSIVGKGELVEAVSMTARRYVETNYKEVDTNKIRVIHRGIDPSVFFLGYRPSREWIETFESNLCQKGRPTIMLPGRVSRLKGHKFFLDVVKTLYDKGTKVNALIVGDPEKRNTGYMSALQAEVEKSDQLRQSVKFLPHRSDLRDIMAFCDLVVNFSNKPESFGRVVLESLSLGTPVVGFDYGGVGELLTSLYPQGKVAPNQLEQTVNTIQACLDSQTEIASHDFHLDSMCRKTLAFYEEASQ